MTYLPIIFGIISIVIGLGLLALLAMLIRSYFGENDSAAELDDQQFFAAGVTVAERVLPIYEASHPDDLRPRQALESVRAWASASEAVRDSYNAAWADASEARINTQTNKRRSNLEAVLVDLKNKNGN